MTRRTKVEAVAERFARFNLPIFAESQIDRILDGMAGVPTISFECVAVTEQQIIDLDLQTRPTKKTDPRAKGFKGESVEVEAIHPNTLREMVEDCITRHIDGAILEKTRRVEQAEREWLSAVVQSLVWSW